MKLSEAEGGDQLGWTDAKLCDEEGKTNLQIREQTRLPRSSLASPVEMRRSTQGTSLLLHAFCLRKLGRLWALRHGIIRTARLQCGREPLVMFRRVTCQTAKWRPLSNEQLQLKVFRMANIIVEDPFHFFPVS